MLLARMADGQPEIFASIQGEGVSTGVPSVFVRLADIQKDAVERAVQDGPEFGGGDGFHGFRGDLASGGSGRLGIVN